MTHDSQGGLRAGIIKTLMLFLALAIARVGAADFLPPDTLVRNTSEEVLRMVAEDKDLKSGDINKLVGLIETRIVPHFDMVRMTRLAVGRGWRQATPEQQKVLVREFQSLLVRSYATAYTAYKQVKVDVRPLRMNGNEDDVIVKTQITLPGGAPPVGVDYSMISTRDGWKVYDVTVDGVSLVTTYRNDFAAQVQQGGIDALIRNLQERNAQFTAQGKK
jgi:phospholipid transport system substrate-binding protein